jgi:peptide/nickel transport system substrate-binding protein
LVRPALHPVSHPAPRVRAGLGVFTMTMAVALTACRGTSTCTANPCGTAVIVATAQPDALFPPVIQSTIGAAISDQIFLKLADIGLGLNTVGDSGFEPRLARSWKFEDPRTLVFELDPRARWQDGVPVTAADVAFTFDVYRDSVVNAPARQLLKRIASVTARDEHTAVFRFAQPYAQQFYDATHQMRVLPRHLLDSIPRARLASHPFNRHPIGDGPYRLVAWNPDKSIELGADSTFFQGRPGLARIVWVVTPDFNTVITQLVADEADITEFLGGPENVARIAAAPGLRVVSYPSATYAYMGFNLGDPGNLARPHPLFGDRELRRALFQGVDRSTLLKAILGEQGKIPVGPVSRMSALGNDTTIPQLAYDQAGAEATLDRLGWRKSEADGIRRRGGSKLEFELLVPASSQIRQRTAVVLQDQLKRLGANARIVSLEFNLFQQRVSRRKFDAALVAWGEDPSPSSIQQTFTSAGIGESNYEGYSNPRFDALVNAAVMATDPAVARAKWREAYGVINEDAPGIWLFTPIQPAAVHRRYEGVTIRPDQWTATLWKWHVAPGKAIPRDLGQRAPG